MKCVGNRRKSAEIDGNQRKSSGNQVISEDLYMPNVKNDAQFPVIRKSVSDPSDLRPRSLQELDRCFSLLSLLGKRVESAGNLVRTMSGNCNLPWSNWNPACGFKVGVCEL